MTLLIKPFCVTVNGFGDHSYFTKTRGKALSEAWGDFGRVSDIPFKDFLKIARARRREAPANFGTEITIDGKKAFFVSCNSQYVQFVYPNSDVILNAHPTDVLPEAMRPRSYGGQL